MKKLEMTVLCALFVGSLFSATVRAEDSIEHCKKTIKNFKVMHEKQVYRGGRPLSEGILALKAAGVHTVIDLQGGDIENAAFNPFIPKSEPGELPVNIEKERQEVENAKMVFFSRPLNSVKKLSNSEEEAIKEILSIMHDPSAQPVYIHCEHGKDRTGLVAALYRIKYDGWSVKEAHDEMIKNGHKGLATRIVSGAMDRGLKSMAKKVTAAQ